MIIFSYHCPIRKQFPCWGGIFLGILALILPVSVPGQVNPDSLKANLEKVSGVARLPILIDLIEMGYNEEPEQAIAYGREALNLLSSDTDPSFIRRVWFWKGSAHEELEQYDSAMVHANILLDLAKKNKDTEGLARGHQLKGLIHWRQNRDAEAIKAYEVALTHFESIDHRQGMGDVLNRLGVIQRGKGNFAAALPFYQRALTLREQLNDSLLLATTLQEIGMTYSGQGNYDQALDFYNRSLEIRKAIGNQHLIAIQLNNIGIIHGRRGNYEKALDIFKQTLVVQEKIGDKAGIANALNNLGIVNRIQGNYDEALSYYMRSLAIREEIGSTEGLAGSLNNIGILHRELGNNEEALSFFIRALALDEEHGARNRYAGTLANLGNTYKDLGNYEAALDAYKRALAIREELPDSAGIAIVLNSMGNVFEDQKKYEAALSHYLRSLVIKTKQGNKRGMAGTHFNIGGLYMRKGLLDSALSYTDWALALADTIGALLVVRDAYKQRSEILEKQGNYAEALSAYQAFKAANDSMYNSESQSVIAELQQQYKTKEQAQRIELLERDKQLQRTWLLALFAGVILLATIGFLIFRHNIKLDKERQINQRLRQVDQLKDQFLANTSHELRTPLNGIIGLAESLQDGVAGNLPQKAQQDLHMIAASGRRLSNLVNDILDFSKLKTQDIHLQFKPIDIHTIADVVLVMSRPLTQGKKLVLHNEVGHALPPVRADENRLQQILLNLVGNAIKFTHEGSIIISAEEQGEFVWVSVRDTGIGIPAKKVGNIFESFEQADSTLQRSYGGTGLGLTITRQLVQLHGGTITVQSAEGQGSVFSFSMPVARNTTAEALTSETLVPLRTFTPVALEKPVAAPSTNGNLFQILAVDDDPVNLQVLGNYLMGENYTLTTAMNGPEALAAIEGDIKFDVVLLDIMMPGMSGYEVCQRIRERYLPSELPILMVTAKNQVGDLVEAFNLRANDYLVKPVSKKELLARMTTHLNLLHINQSYQRFVPRDFFKVIGKENILDVRLGDQIEREVTVMFSDIRGYTTLSETMTVQDNFHFLNAYLQRVVPIISGHNGIIQQFLGDGIMALFLEKPEDAIQASIAYQRGIAQYNRKREAEGRSPLAVGIGLNTGPLMLGIIGDQDRMGAAVVSDTVNTSSRMEGVTKHFGVSLVISEESFNRLQHPDSFHFRYLGKVQVKGKKNVLKVFEFFDGDAAQVIELKKRTLPDFAQGLACYFEKNFEAAVLHFSRVLKVHPEDNCAQLYLKKAGHNITQGVSKSWTGVEVMAYK